MHFWRADLRHEWPALGAQRPFILTSTIDAKWPFWDIDPSDWRIGVSHGGHGLLPARLGHCRLAGACLLCRHELTLGRPTSLIMKVSALEQAVSHKEPPKSWPATNRLSTWKELRERAVRSHSRANYAARGQRAASQSGLRAIRKTSSSISLS